MTTLTNATCGRLFRRRIGRQSLLETQEWCQSQGLEAHEWLNLRWEDEDGRGWSALARLGYLWMTEPDVAAVSGESMALAVEHGLERGKPWPSSHPGESDFVWAWLGGVAQGSVLPALDRAFEGHPFCSLPGGSGWIDQMVQQTLVVSHDLLSSDTHLASLVERFVERLTQAVLWQNQSEILGSPWSLGVEKKQKVCLYKLSTPELLKDDEVFSLAWTALCRIHEGVARKGLLYSLEMFTGCSSDLPIVLKRLTPDAVEAGWDLVEAEVAWALSQHSQLRPAGVTLASALAPKGLPPGWSMEQLDRLGSCLNSEQDRSLVAQVREHRLQLTLPSPTASGHKPRF
jgi:hypothetical protein